jgi:hypothetical protein
LGGIKQKEQPKQKQDEEASGASAREIESAAEHVGGGSCDRTLPHEVGWRVQLICQKGETLWNEDDERGDGHRLKECAFQI